MASFVLDRDPSIKSFPNVFGHTQDQARLGFERADASLCRNENGFAQLPVSELDVGPQTCMQEITPANSASGDGTAT
jgi:hypothetical protein